MTDEEVRKLIEKIVEGRNTPEGEKKYREKQKRSRKLNEDTFDWYLTQRGYPRFNSKHLVLAIAKTLPTKQQQLLEALSGLTSVGNNELVSAAKIISRSPSNPSVILNKLNSLKVLVNATNKKLAKITIGGESENPFVFEIRRGDIPKSHQLHLKNLPSSPTD